MTSVHTQRVSLGLGNIVCLYVCVVGGGNGEESVIGERKKKGGGAVCEQKEVGCRESLKPMCVYMRAS